MIHKFSGDVDTSFFWVIPFLIGLSKSNVDSKSKYNNSVFSLHLTPFFEICFNIRTKK